ncbi:MAG: HAD-IA family hydrolase [Gemmatimonadetes bacterium]|nr:HAD-IA family hydrolase [Gemmatimonadota bacterium]
MTGGATLRAVVFDAGNTLVYVDPRRLLDIFDAGGVPTDLERLRRAERLARRRLQDGVAEGHNGTEPELWREYFDGLLRDGGADDAAIPELALRLREAHARSHLWTWVEPDTPGALQSLLDGGYRLAVVSNADGRVEGVLEDVGLRRYFEFVVDSEVVGVEKPDPRIFLEASSRLGLEAEACLYVGDLYPVDYLGAIRAGMEAVLLDPLSLHGEQAPTVGALAELRPWLETRASRD